MNYEDYFSVEHIPGEVSMDEFILEAMRIDIHIENDQQSLET